MLRQPSTQIKDWEQSEQSPPGKEESTRRHAQTPALCKLRQQVTFEDDPREDNRAGEPHPLIWGDKEGTGKPSDWSRPEARPEKGDCKCLPTLNPLIQEFLSGGEAPWAGDRTEDSHQ